MSERQTIINVKEKFDGFRPAQIYAKQLIQKLGC